MQQKQISFSYEEYDSDQELSQTDLFLLRTAREVTCNAYAPYSHFMVGTAARLQNGKIITGTNQENASFPAGICAERTLLSVAAALYPGIAIEALAISYRNERGASDRPISPCGICRQSLEEYEHRTAMGIRLIMGGISGKIVVVPHAGLLLPFAFSADELG